MIILRKNRILFIACMVCISIFAYSMIPFQNTKTMPTVSLPVSSKTIIIDAGHGVPDERSPVK